MFFFIARKVRSLKNDERNNIMNKIVRKLKPYVDDDSIIESDELDEEIKKKIIDAIESIEKSEDSNSSNSNEQENEENDSDKEAILSHFIDMDHVKVSQNSGEK